MKVKDFLEPFTGGSVFELRGELHSVNSLVALYGNFEVVKVNAAPDVKHPQLVIDEPTCDCYEVTKERHYLTEYEKGYYGKCGERLDYITKEISRCNGIRERDECTCGGYKSQCNFYREKFMKEFENDKDN